MGTTIRYAPTGDGHWPVDQREVDAAVGSYWSVRTGVRTRAADPPRLWNRTAVRRATPKP